MENENRPVRVRVDGETRAYPRGTPYSAVAADFQKNYDCDILLVSRGGKLRELCKPLDRDCALTMLTARSKPGIQTYERSAQLLLLKALYDTVGGENVAQISVEFSISHALFIRTRGAFPLNAALLSRVEARMREIAAQALPIRKRSVPTDDAIEIFRRHRMYDKARLFRYRISSRVNIYSLDGFEDYYYGYMVPHTGYLKYFALEPFDCGFVLRLPEQSDPRVLPEFRPPRKVFREMFDASLKADALCLNDVGLLNEAVAAGGAGDIILVQEAMMEKRIGDIAQEIAGREGVRFVMIAGPSSSGKTTFSHRLCTQLTANGMRPHAIESDNYFKNRADTPKDENGEYNFEGLDAMDVERFNQDMSALLRGARVELPHFNFKKGVREYTGDTLEMGPRDILVIEGIHCLDDRLSFSLPRKSEYRVYISCLTALNVDEHNRIPTTDARLLRRIARDARTRGAGAQATIRMWSSVRRGEESNIFPFQDSADVIFNSALIYEIALLKPYVEPLLFGIPMDAPEYPEAHRLLKFLSYFLAVPSDDVPRASLLREFIGGSCYNV